MITPGRVALREGGAAGRADERGHRQARDHAHLSREAEHRLRGRERSRPAEARGPEHLHVRAVVAVVAPLARREVRPAHGDVARPAGPLDARPPAEERWRRALAQRPELPGPPCLDPLPEEVTRAVLEDLARGARVARRELVEPRRGARRRVPLGGLGDLGEDPVVLARADERPTVAALDRLAPVEGGAARGAHAADGEAG